MSARVVVDCTLRRRGGGEMGALCSCLRLDVFEGDTILRRRRVRRFWRIGKSELDCKV